MLAKLDLDGDFDQATENDEPHQHEAGLRTDDRCGDQFTRAHDGGGENETWSQVLQALPNRRWRFTNRRFVESIGILIHVLFSQEN